ncbi:MAG TPA: BamA/TamA family outer membrane protein [Vicinamibacterales bacterium]|nr:BamA/TamA family outer membrane protein [Vicinamibacterales bacterium]
MLLAVALSAGGAAPVVAQAPAAPQTPPSAVAPQTPSAPAQAPVPPLQPSGTMSICAGQYQIGPPAKLPPAGSGPIVYQYALCFAKQGGRSVIDPNTYLYYIQLKPSLPSQDQWVPYNETTEQVILQDFKRLWATNFLDDLEIESHDYTFSNGVVGKVIVYNMEERQRIKIVDYVGSDKVDQTKIEDELKKKGIQIRLDSFIDPGLVRRVSGIVRDLYAEKGYEFAEVKPEIKPVEGGPKLVHLTFNITEGPKVKIRKIDFLGNKAISDGKLASKMKDNKARGFFGWITGAGTYKEDKWADDAEKVVEYYRERGYVQARVGQPQMKVLEDSKDKKTRWIELQVPVTEGERYKVGEFTFAGNKVVKTDVLKPLFKLKAGDYYDEKKIRKGLDKARELYGTGGYFEFTGYPDLDFPNQPKTPEAPADGAPPVTAATTVGKTGAPIVNVTMRMEEGKQYFVNRITFTGNTTTHDNVIRREIRLYEGGVFNTEALKYSVRRINQLGYFKNIEGDAIDVQKTPGADNKVDVKLKVEEQNRNQITFGAGVSQYDGFFGQLGFQTSNFMGRGETFSVNAQQGDLAKNYQVGFTEPFLFERPITAGIDLYVQDIQYLGQFTQATSGGNIVWGFPVAPFARLYANYSYQNVKIKNINPAYLNPLVLQQNPFLRDSLLVDANGQSIKGGARRIGKIGPSFVYNTVDNPISPTTGRKYSLGFDVAGIGGNTKFIEPTADGVWYFKLNNRTSLGLHGQLQYIRPYGSTVDLPIFEKLFLGGEYSIRGYDLRSIGPRDPISELVTGGNKSLLFNAEYLINIAGPVRLVLFYDAGQVQDIGHGFSWKEPVTRTIVKNVLSPNPGDPYTVLNPITSGALDYETNVIGQASAFKTSTGAEIRFFMPVLNVPFRLIMAFNPQRAGVLDNNLQPEKLFKFRFAVGTTF